MSYEFEKCIEKRRLLRIDKNRQLIEKEMEGALSDLKRTKNDFLQKDYKWAIVKGYYSMFHAAKTFLYSRGYRERSHYCLMVALRELLAGIAEEKHINNFEDAMTLRQEADYDLKFTPGGAEDVITNASRFIDKIKIILGL